VQLQLFTEINMNALTLTVLVLGIAISVLASALAIGSVPFNGSPSTRIAVLKTAPQRNASKPALLGALLLTGAVSGCATIEECGLEGCPSDQKITAHVEAQLEQHPDLDPNTLVVRTINHVVYLDGLVESDLQRDAAEVIAQKVSGVKKVVNSISVNNN
jgi:hypothetical protein